MDDDVNGRLRRTSREHALLRFGTASWHAGGVVEVAFVVLGFIGFEGAVGVLGGLVAVGVGVGVGRWCR